jgi:hypothetical protein
MDAALSQKKNYIVGTLNNETFLGILEHRIDGQALSGDAEPSSCSGTCLAQMVH